MTLNLDKSSWNRVVLGDVASASKEKVDPTDGTVHRYVAGEHMDSNDLKLNRWGDVGDMDLGPAFHRRFRPGQVLYGSRRTYLRKVAVAEFDGVCANTTFVVEPRNRNALLPEFLPFIMSSEPFHAFAIAESKGSVNPYVNWSDIARYEFLLPGPDEQKRIADLLWAIERQDQTLARMGASVVAARTLSLELALEDGEQQGWPEEPVPDLVVDGPRNGKSAPATDDDSAVPTLSISAVREGQIRGGSSVKYMDVPAESVKSFVLERDDFLVVRGNGNKQLTGLGGLVSDGLPDGCVYPDLLIRLRFDRQRVLPAFAAAQWNARARHHRLLQSAKSTNGIWKINGQDIKSHSLITPPLAEQQAIMGDLDRFSSAAHAVRVESAALANLKSSLLADVFGGA